MIKSDLAPDALPLNDEGVDEEGEGVEAIDEIEDIAGSQSLNADCGSLRAWICNPPRHHAEGMHAAFMVE